MRHSIKARLVAVAASLETLARPEERNIQKEKKEAVEEASLEGAITILDKLHDLLGTVSTPEVKNDLAKK